jgi:hypothetical protein
LFSIAKGLGDRISGGCKHAFRKLTLKLNDREFPHKVAELKLGMTAEELQLHFAGHGKSNLDREFDF